MKITSVETCPKNAKNIPRWHALPNPYNGFDRTSTFPVTISLNNSRWNDESRKMLTPTKGNVVKITGFIASVHSDEDNVNHWVVIASEIYFIKETPQASKPAVPGTGEPASHLLYYPLTTCQFELKSLGRLFRTQISLHRRWRDNEPKEINFQDLYLLWRTGVTSDAGGDAAWRSSFMPPSVTEVWFYCI